MTGVKFGRSHIAILFGVCGGRLITMVYRSFEQWEKENFPEMVKQRKRELMTDKEIATEIAAEIMQSLENDLQKIFGRAVAG